MYKVYRNQWCMQECEWSSKGLQQYPSCIPLWLFYFFYFLPAVRSLTSQTFISFHTNVFRMSYVLFIVFFFLVQTYVLSLQVHNKNILQYIVIHIQVYRVFTRSTSALNSSQASFHANLHFPDSQIHTQFFTPPISSVSFYCFFLFSVSSTSFRVFFSLIL